jgi:hypothetical protein
MPGYQDAQARRIFRDLVDMPGDIAITEREITVRFDRRDCDWPAKRARSGRFIIRPSL